MVSRLTIAAPGSAADTASAPGADCSSGTSCPSPRDGDLLALRLAEIAALAKASRAVLDVSQAAGDPQGYLALAASTIARQIGFLASTEPDGGLDGSLEDLVAQWLMPAAARSGIAAGVSHE